MDEHLGFRGNYKNQIQNITLFAAGMFGNGTYSSFADFYNHTFALTFTSTLNETFTTIPITIVQKLPSASNERELEKSIELALESLPNKVITDVHVSVMFGYDHRAGGPNGMSDDTGIAFFNLNVEFSGYSVKGAQNMLVVKVKPCGNGCTPQITGIDILSATDGSLSFVKQQVASDFMNMECGGRGKCDYTQGYCECFSGHTGEACATQTALI
jgi:hypothetical protein